MWERKFLTRDKIFTLSSWPSYFKTSSAAVIRMEKKVIRLDEWKSSFSLKGSTSNKIRKLPNESIIPNSIASSVLNFNSS